MICASSKRVVEEKYNLKIRVKCFEVDKQGKDV
jgi:hypothetical protein